jgi:hypothetical protein
VAGRKCWNSKAHVQIWGNDELTEEFRFKNVLKELIEKTLQLTFAPNLDMSRNPLLHKLSLLTLSLRL